MLNYEWPPIGGGAGKAHLAILRQFIGRDDLSVDVLTSMPQPGFSIEHLAGNITIHKVGIHKKDLHFWRKIEVVEWLIKARTHYRRLLRDNTYSFAHAFFAFPTGWLCYKTADKLPYIISLRGSDVPGYNIRLNLDYKLLSGLFRKIWSRASSVVSNSVGLQKLALKFMPSLEIGVIPNGIDCERFKPVEDKKIGTPVRALTVCRLISRKRINLLIEAAAKANNSGVEVNLDIAGDGNLMNPLKELSEKLGAGKCVNFLGRVPQQQMPELYRNNDIFLMSSAHEGMSNAMLEAMASGLPIITTRCEGVDELIADNGVILENPDAAALAEAISKLAENQQSYKTMSAAARAKAKEFSWNKAAEQYEQLYRRICKEKTTGV